MTPYAVKPGTVVPPRKPARPPRKYPFETMEVGEMFFVPGSETRNFAGYVHKVGKKLGRRFTTQTTTMRQDLKTGEWESCTANSPGSRIGLVVRRSE